MAYATIGEQRVYYRLSANDLTGRRPPLLLLHGAGGTHMHWPAALRRLADWNVYSLDLPGHGKSTGPGRNSVADYRDVVFAFCQALELRQVVLAGHSMGGAIALEFALHYPNRLAGLILVGTGAKLRVALSILDGLRADFATTAQTIADWSHHKSAPEQMRRLYVQRMLENDPEVVYADFYACDQFDRRSDVSRIDTPALVVCGSEDLMTPPRFSEYLAAQMPHARLVLVPNAGHMLPLEAPDELAKAAARFLATLSPEGPAR